MALAPSLACGRASTLRGGSSATARASSVRAAAFNFLKKKESAPKKRATRETVVPKPDFKLPGALLALGGSAAAAHRFVYLAHL